jgi:SWI/SNF-related matrix-associated actin-dependent regulator 1 of chromatin subfamily A
VVFDESHRLKNRTAQTFKAAAKLARRVDRVMMVTGTPILNRAEELWTSMHMLEPDKYKGFWRWAEYHFQIKTPRYRGRLVREVGKLLPGHAKMLRAELGSRLIQKPLSLLLPDLPDVIVTYMTVTLSAGERTAYDSMRENAWMQFGETVTTAPYDITKQLRLRQLASDWSAFNDTGELGAKAKAALDLVEGLTGQQVVIFATFRETVDAIARNLTRATSYHGGMSRTEREAALDRFVTGKCQVLVGTLGTMSEGIDGLQVARNVIFLDRDWTPARNEQAVARLQRSGQMSAVNVIHVVAEDTMDDTVADALRRKQSVIDAVLHNRSGG